MGIYLLIYGLCCFALGMLISSCIYICKFDKFKKENPPSQEG